MVFLERGGILSEGWYSYKGMLCLERVVFYSSTGVVFLDKGGILREGWYFILRQGCYS